MSATIAVCWNVHADAKALRGSIEAAARWADNLFILVTPPGGEKNKDDETCDLLREFGIDPKFDDIERGFGVIRTRLIHECGCDWAMICDADERFFPLLPIMHCEGTDGWSPNTPYENHLKLEVREDICDQGKLLRALINNPQYKAVMSIRRHWFDLGMRRPTQNWHITPDRQLRIVKNEGEIAYRSDVKMHERLIDSRTGTEPRFASPEDYAGVFHEHFHCAFRKAFPGHKEENERRYQRLERGEPMLP